MVMSASEHNKQIEESMDPAESQIHRLGNRPYRQSHDKQHRPNHSSSSPMCNRCGIKGHSGNECRRSKSFTCNSCGKLGHFQKMCRSKPSTQIKTQRNQNYQKKHCNNLNNESEPEENLFHFHSSNSKSAIFHKVRINNHPLKMLIDSGASLNIIDSLAYQNLKAKPPLLQTKVKIYPYQSQTPLAVRGYFEAEIFANNRSATDKVYVITGTATSILAKHTAEMLDLLRVGPLQQIHNISHVPSVPYPSTQDIVNKHENVFRGNGCLKDVELKLHIDKSVVPVQQPIRRIPFHTRSKVDEELKRLLDQDFIEPVTGPTTWLSPIVPVAKKNGKIRLCLDMRRANEAIQRERYVIPTTSDLISELHGAKYFTKIDLREGYHQILLHPESRPITAFATHAGLFQYKRLIFGLTSAFESFEKQIELVLAGIKNVRNISDDILIWGSSLKDHNTALGEVLSRLGKVNLKLNPEKCEIAKPEIIFAGNLLNQDGCQPDPSKIISINKATSPKTTTELKSFLGMVS